MAFLAAGLILLFGGWQLESTRRLAVTEAYDGARNLTRSLAQHMERSIEGVDLILAGIVEHLERGDLDGAGELKPILASRGKAMMQVRAVSVLDENGTWLAASTIEKSGISSADRAFFQWHRDHDDRDLFIGRIITSRLDGRSFVPLSRRWNKPDGSFGGVVLASLNPDDFHAFYRRLDLGPNGVIAAVSEDRHILLRYPDDPDLAKRDLSRSPLFQGRAPGGREGLMRYASVVDRVERIAAYERLDGYPVTVLAARGLDDVLAAWRREAAMQGVALAAAAIGLVGLGFRLSGNQRRMREAEEAIRASEARHREILDTATDAFVSTDAAGAVMAMNGAAERLFQRPGGEALGRPVFGTLIPPRLLETHAAPWLPAEGTGGSPDPERRLELVGLKRDGTEFPIEITVSVTGQGGTRVVNAFIQDISERKLRSKALAESEARFRLLAENTSELIMLGHDDGRRSYISPASERVLAYPPDELSRMHLRDYVHPDDLATLYAATSRLRTEEQVSAIYRAHHKLRGWIWVEGTFRRVPDAPGDAPTIVATFRDIGERRRQQAELETARDAAERASRAKTEFLASMSHEIRTPLNGVIGFTGLILDRQDLDDGLRRQVELIRSSGSALLTIVNDILDFSKIEAGEVELVPRPFAPAGIVEEAAAIVRGQADANGTDLDVVFDAGLPTALSGDADRLRQVLLNLLNNAVKFTRRGVVTVTVSGFDAGVPDHAGLRVVVEDTGIGIPADKLDRLFQRFSQVDGSVQREFGGTGLGLAISRRLIELMGGTIGVSSVEGRGSRFWFTVTMPRVAAPVVVATDRRAAPPAREGFILVVDDIPMNLEIARAVLEAAGHRVETAGDGAGAIEAVTRCGYDLVLMDVQMPVLDGINATRRIRALGAPTCHVPILAMTANVLPDEVAGLLAAGMDGHVGKPFRREDLIGAVSRILASDLPSLLRLRRAAAREAAREAAALRVRRTGAHAIINRTTLSGLYDVLPPAAVGALLARLRHQIVSGPLLSLGTAEEAEPGDISHVCHNLVSSAGLLGFERLSDLCRTLEGTIQSGGDAETLRRAVSDACREVVAIIDSDLEGASAA